MVKLADFPAYVDAMHRDSGLLFADGFRVGFILKLLMHINRKLLPVSLN